jgi:hypothetical protein
VLRALVLPTDPHVLLAEQAVWSHWLTHAQSDADAAVLTAALQACAPEQPVLSSEPSVVRATKTSSARSSHDPVRDALRQAVAIAQAAGLDTEQHGVDALTAWAVVEERVAALPADTQAHVAPWIRRWRALAPHLRQAGVAAGTAALEALPATPVDELLWASVIRLVASQAAQVAIEGNTIVVSQLRGPPFAHALDHPGEWAELLDLRSPDVSSPTWRAECVAYRVRVPLKRFWSIGTDNPLLTFAYWLDRDSTQKMVQEHHPQMPPVWVRAVGAELGDTPTFRGEIFIFDNSINVAPIEQLP